MEYGIFDPSCGEECLDSGFYSRQEALEAARNFYGFDEAKDLEIHELCPDHPDYARASCPDCAEA